MEDTFEGLEDDDLEEEADKEVDKVLFEITNGKAKALGMGVEVGSQLIYTVGQSKTVRTSV